MAENQNLNYNIITLDDGKTVIIKKNTPNLRIIVKKGLTITEQSLKNYPNRSIFIDGVYSGKPFINIEKNQYSLDHHEGVIRNITLASCEQALVMILKGLTLDEGIWYLYVNEPDLDSVLALWVLVNFSEIFELRETILQKVVRLVRTEGIIDVHGFTMAEFLGYETTIYENQKTIIDKLTEQERQLKKNGEWEKVDFTTYTMNTLGKIDIIIYGTNREIKKQSNIVELAKFNLTKSNKYLIACESSAGIYEIEDELKKKYPNKIGIIVFKSNYGGNNRYTLRLANDFITPNLIEVYKELNHIDKAVKKSKDGSNKWGGSENIGGSPKETGTLLKSKDIIKVFKNLYCKRSFWDRIRNR